MAQRKPRIIIVGSGFAGVSAAQEFGRRLGPDEAEVLLVSKTNHFTFTPMLPEAAGGGLNIQYVVEAARHFLRGTNIHLVVTEVQKIDLEKKVLYASDCELEFDYLLLATGSTTNFFGVPGGPENCYVLKDIHDAAKVRARITEQFEAASRLPHASDRKKLLTFAAIGGGPTGIELITEINELIRGTFTKLYPQIDIEKEVTITVLDMAPFILMPFAESLRAKALEIIQKQGIKVLLSTSVTGITPEGIQLGDGTLHPAATVFWTAGVKPNIPEIVQEIAKDKGGRITVEPTLQLPGMKHIFCAGDAASFMHGERPLPMLAQVAHRQGPAAAANIVAVMRKEKLQEYNFQLQGSLATLGKGQAVAEVGPFKLSGWVAWLMWRVIYLVKFESWNRRFKIVNEWFIGMFTERDVAKP